METLNKSVLNMPNEVAQYKNDVDQILELLKDF